MLSGPKEVQIPSVGSWIVSFTKIRPCHFDTFVHHSSVSSASSVSSSISANFASSESFASSSSSVDPPPENGQEQPLPLPLPHDNQLGDDLFEGHYRVKPSPSVLLCTFVLHQLLTAVKPQFRVLAGKVSSSPTLCPSSNSINFPTNLPLTCEELIVSRWAPLFMCSLNIGLVLKVM